MSIPIVSVLIPFSIFVLLLLNNTLWKKRKEGDRVPGLETFQYFLLILLAAVFVYGLPLFLVHDLVAAQLLDDAGKLLLTIAFAFLLRMILLLTFPSKKRLVGVAPLVVIGIALGGFIWQIAQLSPMIAPIEVFSLNNLIFISYKSSAPLIPTLIEGITGLLIALFGALMFYWRGTLHPHLEPILRKRALLLAFGHVLGALSILNAFILDMFPTFTFSFPFAVILNISAILFLYRGVTLSPSKKF